MGMKNSTEKMDKEFYTAILPLSIDLFFLMLIYILLSACTPKPKINFPEYEPKLAVWGYLNPDSIPEIYITRNKPPLDSAEIEVIDSALAILYEDGTPVDTFEHEEKGFYRTEGSFKPQAGKSYHISVFNDGFQPAYTKPDRMPAKPIIDRYETRILSSTGCVNCNNVLAQITVYLKETSIADYIGHEIQVGEIRGPGLGSDRPCNSEDVFLYKKIYFSDLSCFENSAVLNFELRNYQRNELDSVSVKLCFTTPIAYNFHKKLDKQNSFTGPDIFYQAIYLPEVVVDGLGYFGVYNCTEVKIKF